MTTACINFQGEDRREQRGTAFFLWEHRFSPGGGLSGMLTLGRAGLCFRAELVCPGAGSPGTEMWLWEMWCSRCWHRHQELGRAGCWPLSEREAFLSRFPSRLGMKSHSGASTSVYLCGKGGPWGFYLTFTYAKMQRAVLFFLLPFSFWLRKELWLFAEYIHTEASSIAECMHLEVSSRISDVISW